MCTKTDDAHVKVPSMIINRPLVRWVIGIRTRVKFGNPFNISGEAYFKTGAATSTVNRKHEGSARIKRRTTVVLAIGI